MLGDFLFAEAVKAVVLNWVQDLGRLGAG